MSVGQSSPNKVRILGLSGVIGGHGFELYSVFFIVLGLEDAIFKNALLPSCTLQK